MIVVYYQDKGPNGPCGQCMSITRNFNQVHIFMDDDEGREALTRMAENDGRRHPKFYQANEVIVHDQEGTRYFTDYENDMAVVRKVNAKKKENETQT